MTVPGEVKLERHANDLDDDGHDIYAGGGTDDQTAAEVPFTPAAGIAATDVQAAIEEAAGDTTAHLADTVDAHDASAVSVADAGTLFTATDVEAALQELAKKDIGYTAHSSLGSTETFSALTGWHSGTFSANCTATFSGATSGLVASMVLELTSDGSSVMTWPVTVLWASGSAPTLSTTPGDVDVILFMSRDGGTTWYGFPTGGSGGSALTIKDEGSSLTTTATSIDFVGPLVTASGTGAGKTVTVTGALDDLTDVVITSAASAQRLRYNGSSWVNSSLHWQPMVDYTGLVMLDSGGNPSEHEVT